MPIAAFLAIATLGLMASSWLVDRAAVRQAVEAQVRATTGLDLVVNGGIDVSIFPYSRVALHDVTLKGANADENALYVNVLTANLRLLPLLLQRVDIADVNLSEPRINVTRGADGLTNWAPVLERMAQSMKPGSGHTLSFSEILIEDGVLNYRDERRGIGETITDLDISLAWPSISRSFAATGQFDWRDERVDGSVSIADLAAALSGERSGLKARMTSAPVKFAFDGAFANRASLMMDGIATADSPSLRNVLRWTGQSVPANGSFGRFALKARANVVADAIALTNVNIELDGNVAEGVLTINSGDRRTLQGTLAADALDLTPYVQTIRLLASGTRDWNRQIFDLHDLADTDLDLRLSAAKVKIGGSKLGRTAIGANLRAGKLAVSVGEAQIFGGIARGSFGLESIDDVANVKTQFQLKDIDLDAATVEVFGSGRLTGRGNIDVALDATGGNAFELAQSLDGTATLDGRDGAITGFNVEQLLKRLERRPLSGTGNFRSGTTPFSKLTVAVRFNDGVANADDIVIEGPATRLTLNGTASVPGRDYDLKGVASLVSTGDAAPGFQLPFVVQGPWDDPLIFPDSDILIRRSPASAPLLDSLKDRKTRDAVRAVIERFTGVKKPAPETDGATTDANPASTAGQLPTGDPAAKSPAATSGEIQKAN
jgi:AsmA protein